MKRRMEKRSRAAIAVLLLGALFMGLGIFRGEAGTVWHKAVLICMECIGIG